MKAVGFAVLIACVMAFVFVFVPKLMPTTQTSDANAEPPPLRGGASAVSGDQIALEGRIYQVERLRCPAPGTEEGDGALAALTQALEREDTKCLRLNDAVLRCAIGTNDLADVMQDTGLCTKK
ncbi:MAG: hypothetical protein ACSHWZ_12975 [Sulfitobacter sp.]